MPEPVRYETPAEAARRTNTSIKTIYRRIHSGDLKAYRHGVKMLRLDPAEVDAMLTPVEARCASIAEAAAQRVAEMLTDDRPWSPEKIARLAELLAPPRDRRAS